MDRIGNALSATPPASASLTSAAKRLPSLCSRSEAVEVATAIFGSFRRNDTDDPDVFLSACEMLFASYPRDVVIALSHPKSGIAGEQTFMPSIAELRAALDRRVEVEAAKERRQREAEEVRRYLEAPLDVATPEERDRAVRRYCEEIGRPLLPSGKRASERQILGATQEQWDALPDRAPAPSAREAQAALL